MIHDFDYGDPRLPQRFWDKVYPCPVTGCWLWGASATKNGYGRISVTQDGVKRPIGAHRFAYLGLVGSITDQLDHLCRQTFCCRPDHLEDVAQIVNWSRGQSQPRKNMDLTHCPKDHPYSGDNLYVTKQGYRQCRTCHRDAVRLAKQGRRHALLRESLNGGGA